MELLIMLVALFAIMYFLMIRPQQKRMKADQEMRQGLVEGDRVLLTSGIFATISHIGERQFIVEIAPDAEVTILKGNVARKVDPSEEEFEFSDDVPEGVTSEVVPDDASSLAADSDTFDPTPAPGEGIDAADEAGRTEDNK